MQEICHPRILPRLGGFVTAPIATWRLVALAEIVDADRAIAIAVHHGKPVWHAGHELIPADQPIAIHIIKGARHALLFAHAVASGKTDWRFGGDIGVRVTEILADAERMTAPPQEAA